MFEFLCYKAEECSFQVPAIAENVLCRQNIFPLILQRTQYRTWYIYNTQPISISLNFSFSKISIELMYSKIISVVDIQFFSFLHARVFLIVVLSDIIVQKNIFKTDFCIGIIVKRKSGNFILPLNLLFLPLYWLGLGVGLGFMGQGHG